MVLPDSCFSDRTVSQINSGSKTGMISNPRFLVGRKVQSSCQQIIRAIFIFFTHSQQSTVNSQQSIYCPNQLPGKLN